MSKVHDEWEELMTLMKETTNNLRRMGEISESMRFQYENKAWEEFSQAMNDATEGWIASHC